MRRNPQTALDGDVRLAVERLQSRYRLTLRQLEDQVRLPDMEDAAPAGR